MRLVLRVLLGLVGLLGLLVAVRLWADPAAAAGKLGLVAQGGLGLATLRADLAGFFGVAGGLTLVGAIRSDGRLLAAPLLLVAAALAGRAITVVASGLQPEMVAPMAIEAVLVVLLVAGRRAIDVGQGGGGARPTS